LNYWKQLNHVMKYFRSEEDPTVALPKNFVSGFLEVCLIERAVIRGDVWAVCEWSCADLLTGKELSSCESMKVWRSHRVHRLEIQWAFAMFHLLAFVVAHVTMLSSIADAQQAKTTQLRKAKT
jgi:hypothetical protein